MPRGGKRQSLVIYNDALANFICDKVEDGISVAELCRTYQDQEVLGIRFPTEKTIYRWKKQYPAFGKTLDQAYQVFFYRQLDELNELSKELMKLTHQLTSADKGELLAFRMRAEAVRQRIEVLKFSLARIAPKFVEALKDQPSTAVQVPVINVIKYDK